MYSSFDQPMPRPQIHLPCDKTSRVANCLPNITGLWNNMSNTHVPSAILSVFAATKVSVSRGSNTFCIDVDSLPSGDPGHGVCGFKGQSNLSPTQIESRCSCSALIVS